MAATTIPQVTLHSSSGHRKMPVIGLGTAPEATSTVTTKDAVLEAIKQGYRHFDAASAYGVEQSVGEAIAEALKLGLVQSRDELFVTSKLWVTDNHAHTIVPALQKSLRSTHFPIHTTSLRTISLFLLSQLSKFQLCNSFHVCFSCRTLQLEYLDLYLIHWPIATKPGKVVYPIEVSEIVEFDLKGVWESMEECQKLGLTKAIGVSNFSISRLEKLLSFATIPPAVNQVIDLTNNN